jgi:hypothetical protein
MAYSPPENPKPGKTLICEECGHGRSNHPLVGDAKAPSDPVTAKRTVLQAFNTRAGGRMVDLLKTEGTSNSPMEQARQETLSGFRDQVIKKVKFNAAYRCGTHDFVPCFPERKSKAGQKKENINGVECQGDLQGGINCCSDMRDECESNHRTASLVAERCGENRWKEN